MTDNENAVGSYQGMLDNLVTQFSSALDCFRELVQNSIDAGTPRVDVWMEFLRGEGHEGTIVIHVDDFGSGMDEEIIDQELTQLFASGKTDDLTKIGKFGIGFVSVFALEPRAVLVHTGRSGEYWEVLFHEDRSFSKSRVDTPVEGTQIAIFIEGEYHRYQELAEEIPKTLRHWCSHSEVEVTFEDRTNNTDFSPPETINEEFAVHGECLQHIDEHQGTEMVLAYSEEPVYGFYNRGLTLALTDVGVDVLDRWNRRFEFISFKIKSRYLEHTLARDSVIRDEQYEKAMTLLEEAANGPLLTSLIEELEQLATSREWAVEEYHRYARLLRFLANEPPEEVAKFRERPILRCLNSAPMSLGEAHRRFRSEGRLLLRHETSPLVEELRRRDVPVLLGATERQATGHLELRYVCRLLTEVFAYLESRTVRGIFRSALGQMVRFVAGGDDGSPEVEKIRRAMVKPEWVYYPIAVDDEIDEKLKPLFDEALKLLEHAEVDLRKLVSGVVEAAEGDAPFVVVSHKVEALMARPSADVVASGKRLEAAVNRNHPHFDVVFRLYQRDPAMGAYLLARGLVLSDEMLGSVGDRMVEAAIGGE